MEKRKTEGTAGRRNKRRGEADGRQRGWKTSERRGMESITNTRGKRNKTNNIQRGNIWRGEAADDRETLRGRNGGGDGEEGRWGRETKGLYQWFKQSRQTASWRTAGSEQRAAKADKRLIQAWRAPLITHIHARAHTYAHVRARTHTWIEDALALLPQYNPHSHTELNTHTHADTHLNGPPDTLPQSGNKEKKNHLSRLIQHKKSWEAEKSDSCEAKYRDHDFSNYLLARALLLDLVSTFNAVKPVTQSLMLPKCCGSNWITAHTSYLKKKLILSRSRPICQQADLIAQY